MKKEWIRILGTAAVLLFAAAAFQPANAVCANARAITTFDVNSFTTSFVYTPGACVPGAFPCQGAPYFSSVTGSLTGSFWGIGVGNPATGLGADNGTFAVGTYGTYIAPYAGWITGYFYYPAKFTTTWAADPGIDGCIDISIPVGTKCTAVLLSDEISDQGYFMFMTELANANQNYVFWQTGAAPITLVKVPKVGISGSSRISSSAISVTVDPPYGASPGATDGFILDPGCAGVGTPTTWTVKQRAINGHGGSPPTGRDETLWSADLSAGKAFDGTSDTVTATCTGEQDIYLAYSINFDSGYTLDFVGDNSTRIECGENLAEPAERPTQLQIQDPRLRRKPGGARRGGR